MEVTKVSKEAIEKAEIALGLRKAGDANQEDATKTEELKKAEEAKAALESEYATTIAKAQELKNKIEGKSEAVTTETTIAKAVDNVAIENLQKSFDEKFSQMAILVQGKTQENEELKKSVETIGQQLQKAQEFNEILGKKVGIIAKQPLDRKSIQTTGFIEKGNGTENKLGNESNQGSGFIEKSLSNSAHRSEVADLLFEKATEGGRVDKDFEKAVSYVELGAFPNRQAQERVQKFLSGHKIKLVK